MGGRGGAGGSAPAVGTKGTGIRIESESIREKEYFVDASGKYRGVSTGKKLNLNNEQIKKMVSSEKATIVAKEEMDRIRENRREERKKTPDYELGNPFREAGWGARQRKSVIRPRRRKD